MCAAIGNSQMKRWKQSSACMISRVIIADVNGSLDVVLVTPFSWMSARLVDILSNGMEQSSRRAIQN